MRKSRGKAKRNAWKASQRDAVRVPADWRKHLAQALKPRVPLDAETIRLLREHGYRLPRVPR